MNKKEISMSIRFMPEIHKALKILAAKEGKTAKQCILEGLDKAFPGWRDEDKK
jgi:Antitoxin ParD.